MVFPNRNSIDLLFPGMPPERQDVARTLATFMALLLHDARSESTTMLVPDPGRASLELQRHVEERAGQALEVLLSVTVAGLLGPGSFAWFGKHESGEVEAWETLREMRPAGFRRAFPRSGETGEATARRLILLAEAVGMPADRRDQWRARVDWATVGPARALPGLRACLRAAQADEGSHRTERLGDCALDVASAELDCGRPSAALRFLAGLSIPGGAGLRARVLTDWAALLCTGVAPDPGPVASAAPLPGPLLELRADAPEWLPGLLGRGAPMPAEVGAESGGGAPPVGAPVRQDLGSCAAVRAAVGAVAVALFARQGEGFVPVDSASDPAQAEQVACWLEELGRYWCDGNHPVHRLLLTGAPVVVRAGVRPGKGVRRLALPSTIRTFSNSSLGVAVAPVLDPRGVVAGWLYLEFSHHLIPSRGRLGSLARGLAPALVSGLPGLPGDDDGMLSVRSGAQASSTADPRVAPFAELVAKLRVKTAHRRWWGYVRERGRWVPVAGGGRGLRGSESGGAHGLARVLDTGSCFRFSEPDAHVSVHAQAASGWAVPLLFSGRLVGVLAMESERRSDFRPGDAQRAADLAAGEAALAAELAGFAREQLVRNGNDLFFDPASPGFEDFARRLDALRSTRHPLTLSGPSGSGKATLASWVHLPDEGRGELQRLDAGELSVDGLRAWGTVPGANILLAGVERLSATGQTELARLLRRRIQRAASPGRREYGRWMLTLGSGEQTLVPGLAKTLSRLCLRVPGLARRRSDVPGLARFLLSSLARREGLSVPLLTDATCGLLWRQPWPDNVRGLIRVLHPWVLAFAGREIGVEDAVRHWSGPVPGPLKRLNPRSLAAQDLTSALYSTRTAGDRVNKTRAAAYLGWDPITLAQHMRASGLSGSVPLPANWD